MRCAHIPPLHFVLFMQIYFFVQKNSSLFEKDFFTDILGKAPLPFFGKESNIFIVTLLAHGD